VLQIATILPGQAPDRRFSIPSHRSMSSISRAESHRSTNPPASATEEGEKQAATPLADVGEAPFEAKGAGVTVEAAQPEKPVEAVRRLDSQTNDVDVFQDARS
jgi:hypothetical protein